DSRETAVVADVDAGRVLEAAGQVQQLGRQVQLRCRRLAAGQVELQVRALEFVVRRLLAPEEFRDCGGGSVRQGAVGRTVLLAHGSNVPRAGVITCSRFDFGPTRTVDSLTGVSGHASACPERGPDTS